MHIIDAVPSEAKCRSIIKRQLFGKRVYCPYCMYTKMKRFEGRFFCPRCRKKFSLTSCSFMRRMRIPYRKAFTLLICWQRKVPFGLAASLAGVSPPTARRWFRLFREHLPHDHEEFWGTVEIDEAYFGRRRTGNQRMVIGAIERRTGKVILRQIRSRSYEETDDFILDHVMGGSTVCTDGAQCYEGISGFWGYRHIQCNHSIFHFGPTNRIEAVWSALKRFLRRTFDRPTAKYLPEILREFQTRINTPKLFDSPLTYLENCLTLVPLAC